MLVVKDSQPVKKKMKMQVHMMSHLSSFGKFLLLTVYQIKMNAFAKLVNHDKLTRLVNHDKKLRLQSDILKRVINTAANRRNELKKFVLSYWNIYARLVSHDEQLRLQSDILKRFLNTATNKLNELKKFVL